MQISNITSCYNIPENMQKLNEMMKNISDVQMNLSNKMIKLNVVQKINGLGENIDISV